MSLSFSHIKPLLDRSGGKFSQWAGYIGLGVGMLFLLLGVQWYFNVRHILKDKEQRSGGGYEFVSISKEVTNENMGLDNRFTMEEIQALEATPTVVAAAPLVTNQFRVRASAGALIPFSTDLFLESLPDQFLDTVPPGFTWQPGQRSVPVIFSADLLEMYNVFAPAQGLPQISPETLRSVNIILQCAGSEGAENYYGHVVALTDRISSILAPRSFMDWNNLHLAGVQHVQPARVYLKTINVNTPSFIHYLDVHGYHINQETIKLGRMRSLLQKVTGALSLLGVGVVIMALLLFSFYLQLMISRSRDQLRLLITLGYSPRWLAKLVSQSRMPVYLSIIFIALVVTAFIQVIFSRFSFARYSSLSGWLHWATFLVAALLLGIALWLNNRLVKKELKALMDS